MPRQAESRNPVCNPCRQRGVSDDTCPTREKTFVYLDMRELHRLRMVEEENRRLKRLVAHRSLNKHRRSEAWRNTFMACPTPGHGP